MIGQKNEPRYVAKVGSPKCPSLIDGFYFRFNVIILITFYKPGKFFATEVTPESISQIIYFLHVCCKNVHKGFALFL